MNEVKILRQETGLSQRCFAERFGIPVRTLQQWEQGAQKPPSYVVNMLSELVKDGQKIESDLQSVKK